MKIGSAAFVPEPRTSLNKAYHSNTSSLGMKLSGYIFSFVAALGPFKGVSPLIIRKSFVVIAPILVGFSQGKIEVNPSHIGYPRVVLLGLHRFDFFIRKAK